MERDVTRRAFVMAGAGVVAAGLLARDGVAAAGRVEVKKAGAAGRAGVLPAPAFEPLLLGEVRPAGWLERQLRIQADGMSGHLHEFWPDVGANSGWLGGTGESWERGPYFVDGLLPLAVVLGDQRLRGLATDFVNWTLEHQAAGGMIGPVTNDDWWPRMVMVKVLAQHYEATTVAGQPDERVIAVLTKYFHHQMEAMPGRPLRSWGKYRWQDEAYVVAWLYRRTGDPKLLQLAALLQQQGVDWVAIFRDFKHTGVTPRSILQEPEGPDGTSQAMETHGVNNGQALKVAPVRFLFSGNAAERENYARQIRALDQYHGMPNGMFSCDEHLGGLDQVHGTELCTVVETMFSHEIGLGAFGDPALADRIEEIAYNALPGTFTDDMWAHQYDQQPNQVQSSLNSKPWTTNGVESNLYGLEPHFGCCTANYHQGWPKYVASLWMRPAGGGLAAVLWAPCAVRTTVSGVAVRVRVETEYPFRETATVRVDPERAMRFPLLLRVPGWAEGATVRVNGRDAGVPAAAGTFARVERDWTAGDVVEVRFPMKPRVRTGYRGAATVVRGPVVFSFDPGEQWVRLREQGLTADWQVFPVENWNYGLRAEEAAIEVVERPVGARPFSREGAGIRLRVPGRKLLRWRSEDGVAGTVPEGPQTSGEPERMLELVPYGAAKLRVTAFPVLAAEQPKEAVKVGRPA